MSERQRIIIHLRFLVATERQKLRDLEGLLTQQEVDEILDKMKSLLDIIDRLEKGE